MAEEKEELQHTQEAPAPSQESQPEVSAQTAEEVPDMSEFEGKAPVSSDKKDLWLFLIIIDIICLCAFGFFLYKNLSAKLLTPPANPPAFAEQEEVWDEAPSVQVISEEMAPAVETVVTETVVEEVAATTEPVVEEKPVAAAPVQPTEKKQSVIIKANAKSKYRQVTFRYFGDAKSVAIVSGFTMTKPRAMTKKNGVWETTLSILPGNYKYLFVVDGKQITDPYAEEKNGRSVLVVK